MVFWDDLELPAHRLFAQLPKLAPLHRFEVTPRPKKCIPEPGSEAGLRHGQRVGVSGKIKTILFVEPYYQIGFGWAHFLVARWRAGAK